MKGSITIVRFSSTQEMEISFEDESSRIRFLRAKISASDLMLALTGLAGVGVEFELYPENIGKHIETKTEVVPFVYYGSTTDEIRAAIARFEVDGWRGRDKDVGNHHNMADGGYRVIFHRYVEGGEQ